MLDETKEKEKRKLNIIVANLPESREGSVEERKRDDTDKVRQLVSKITDVWRAVFTFNPTTFLDP